ncbi:MAG: hypothetical protein NTX03_09900 [Bacteroidetes bacterium]|nr:hypothetical protein [Bacteroidota bacterium]
MKEITKYFILIFIVLQGSKVLSQDTLGSVKGNQKLDTLSDKYVKTFQNPHNSISFYPLTLLEPEMGIRLSFEKPITKNLYLQPGVNFIVIGLPYYKGFVGRIDLKNYYLINEKARNYVAAELMYKFTYKTFRGPIRPYSVYSTEEHFNVISANFKWGVQIKTMDRNSVEIFTGIGLRYYYVEYKMSDGTTMYMENPIAENGIKYKNFTPNFVLGGCFNFHFGQPKIKE